MRLPTLPGLAAMVPAPSNLAWGLGGIAICAVVTVSAQQYTASSSEAPPCAISDAIQQAINSKVALIGVTGTDPSKYFAVGSATSCLDGLLSTSFDLSKLIPDPMGWVSDAAMAAVKKATEAAVGKVCQAARNSMGDIIGKYNGAVGVVTGWKSSIDGSIAGQSVASYGTSYSNPVSVSDVLANVPANTMANVSPSKSVQMVAANSTASPAPAVPAPVVSPTPYAQTPAATPKPLTSAQATYQTPAQYQQVPQQQAQPVTPATVGTSVFGR